MGDTRKPSSHIMDSRASLQNIFQLKADVDDAVKLVRSLQVMLRREEAALKELEETGIEVEMQREMLEREADNSQVVLKKAAEAFEAKVKGYRRRGDRFGPDLSSWELEKLPPIESWDALLLALWLKKSPNPPAEWNPDDLIHTLIERKISAERLLEAISEGTTKREKARSIRNLLTCTRQGAYFVYNRIQARLARERQDAGATASTRLWQNPFASAESSLGFSELDGDLEEIVIIERETKSTHQGVVEPSPLPSLPSRFVHFQFLYAIVVTKAGCDREKCRWGILSPMRFPVEHFPPIEVYLKDEEKASSARFVFQGKVAVDSERKKLNDLSNPILCLWRHHQNVLGLVTECERADISTSNPSESKVTDPTEYFLVPLRRRAEIFEEKDSKEFCERGTRASPHFEIDWSRVLIPYDGTGGQPVELQALKANPSDFILIRRKKMYLCAGVPDEVRGSTPMDSNGETFVEYYKRKYSIDIDGDKPLVECYVTYYPRSSLRPYKSKDEYKNIFFPCKLLRAYPVDFRRLGRLTAVLHRFQAFASAVEILEGVGISPSATLVGLIRQALTHRQATDVDHYERLELLGDSVIKFAISAWILESEECGDINVLRSKLESNEAFEKLAHTKDLIRHGIYAQFQPRYFRPPFFKSHSAIDRIDRPKRLAPDIIESLTAAFFLTGGYETSCSFMNFLAIPFSRCADFGCEPSHCLTRNRSFFESDRMLATFSFKGIQPLDRAESATPDASRCAEALGYQFRDTQLLEIALNHVSPATDSGRGDGQAVQTADRLWFLGDSILKLIVTAHLHKDRPSLTEGEASQLREQYLRAECLSALLIAAGLTSCLGADPEENMAVRSLEECLRRKDETAKDAILVRKGCKILAKRLKAVIASVFIDSDQNFNVAARAFSAVVSRLEKVLHKHAFEEKI